MLLKDFIEKLQTIYDSYGEEDKKIFGEPDIMIDVFRPTRDDEHLFEYTGFDREIEIERSDDGVYLIISKFAVKLKE